MNGVFGDRKRNLELLLLGNIYYFKEKMSAYRIVLKGGSSWSAKNFEKNRTVEKYAEALACRRYARKVFNTHFPNEYISFRLVTHACLQRLTKPTEESKEVVRKIIAEHSSVLRFFFHYCYLACVGFPQYIYYKLFLKKRYLLHE